MVALKGILWRRVSLQCPEISLGHEMQELEWMAKEPESVFVKYVSVRG